jgi:hypothetical protein
VAPYGITDEPGMKRRSAASAEHVVVLRRDEPITLARGGFEIRPVEDGDDAPAVANQARASSWPAISPEAALMAARHWPGR